MGEKLIVGRYIPYDSYVHHMDPRAKFIIAITYIALLFVANNWLTYTALILFSIAGIYLSRIPVGYFLRGIRPMIWLITFTAVLQILFTPSPNEIFSLGLISISQRGIERGLLIFLRFIQIIVISTLLTLTTEALELADAIEFFLKPLNKIKFPVAETTMMLSISLRFVPTMVDEADVIMNAQKSRGVSFDEGTLIERIRSFVPILVPLFINSYDRAPQLATAMEARGYQGGENRTKFREFHWKTTDTLAICATALLIFTIHFLKG